MLPATKSVPKELLPIGEKPALQLIIEEAVGAGVDHVIVISSPSKGAIAEYLAPSDEVVTVLERQGRADLAEGQRLHTGAVRISVVVQEEARGLGDAVNRARGLVGDEPFFVLLPDELMEGSALLSAMAEVYGRVATSVIAVKRMPRADISRYGVVCPVDETASANSEIRQLSDDDIVMFDDVVEKPDAASAPSDLAIIGRYLLTPDIFDDLDRIVPGASGELQLTDALAAQAARQPSVALVSTFGRRDIGNPLGWVQAVIEHAVRHPQIGADVMAWMKEEFFGAS